MNQNHISEAKKKDFKTGKIKDYETGILFNSTLELIWSRCFTKFGWKWTYHKKSICQFKVKISNVLTDETKASLYNLMKNDARFKNTNPDEVEFPVKIVDSDKYEILEKELNQIKRVRGIFLVLGNKMQDYSIIEEQMQKNEKEKKFKIKYVIDGVPITEVSKIKDNTENYEFSKYIGLIGYNIFGDSTSSMVFLCKNKTNNQYSIGWKWDELNWIFDLQKFWNFKITLDYASVSKIDSKYQINKEDSKELDKLWKSEEEKL